MSKNVVIIGGGIIGLCSAYYLQKDGHQVTVINKSDMTNGASFVNAGFITPSHFTPFAAPGVIGQGLKWMFRNASPFYVKPRLDLELLKWFWAFKKSATVENVEKAIPVIKEINMFGRDLYKEIRDSGEFDFHYEQKGLLMAYRTDKAGDEEWIVGQQGIEEGLKVRRLNQRQVYDMEPHAKLDCKGAIYYEDDAHMTPGEFMNKMLVHLRKNGVNIHSNEAVEKLVVSGGKISKIITSNRKYDVDEVVLSAGSWSSLLVKNLGLKIPIQAGKGYRINIERYTGINTPTILVEAKVAVTPMNGFTRFSGTMEMGGLNHKINSSRVNAIKSAAELYYKELTMKQEEVDSAACGLRPCSPDGLPYIGRASQCRNLTIGTGHAMMGWSLGPATGKLISELISDRKTSLSLLPFHPDRKI